MNRWALLEFFEVTHYKKRQSLYIEDPPRINELRVAGVGKVHDLSIKAGRLLKDHPTEGIHVSAVGNHVTKAVTVVEILKKKLKGLQQVTTIKYARVEDVWEPDMEGLDSMKVTRKIPSVSVHLMETAESAAESAVPEAPPLDRPSSNRTRKRRRGRSKGDQDSAGGRGACAGEVTAGEGIGELKLRESPSAELAKGTGAKQELEGQEVTPEVEGQEVTPEVEGQEVIRELEQNH